MRGNLTRSGFTIIELVLVLTISSILAAIAIIRLTPSTERARLRNSATMIASDLQYAQMIAARQRRPVRVVTVESMKSYIIQDVSAGTIFRETHLGQDTEFRVDLLQANPTMLEIFPNGVVRSEGNFTVTVHDLSRNVRISRAGQVRITNDP